jgi:hypothetical protein
MPYYIIPDSWLTYSLGQSKRIAKRTIARGKGFGGNPVSRGSRSVSTGITYSFKDVIFYEPVIQTFLHAPNGAVGRWLTVQGTKVVAGAKAQVGVRTGRLRESIRIQDHRPMVGGQIMKIGSTVNYAYVHHEGMKPRIITPKGTTKTLRFRTGARIIYSKRVVHPGFKPNRYLKDSLRLIDGVK